MATAILHSYFRSSTSYRARIALNLKGVSYQIVSHHLRKKEHQAPEYLAVNPQGLVPALVLPGKPVLTQSLAIIEYLDETIPEPPFLPKSPEDRARVRALAQMIAIEIHPLNNLRVLRALRHRFGADEEVIGDWFRDWVVETFGPLEEMLASDPRTGRFCHGDTPGLADICLVPQVANNARYDIDMAPYRTIRRINDACMALEAFQQAAPARQPDAEA